MLSIFQGNDKTFILTRKDTTGKIINTLPKDIWFTVKESYENKSIVFQKRLNHGIIQSSDGTWNIQIDAADTAELKTGRYICDVKIIDEKGKNVTIVKPQDFAVIPVVTRLTNQGG